MSEQNKQSKVKLYRVFFEDSVTHTGLWVRLFTKQGLILMLVSCVVALLIIFYLLFAFTPLRRQASRVILTQGPSVRPSRTQ